MKLSARIPPLAAFALIVVVAAWAALPASGQTFHGRLTTSFYRYDRAPTDSTEFDYVRAYALGIFHLEGLADRRFSLHTYLTGQQDLATVNHDPSDYRVSNLYAQWKDKPHGYELRGGRMRIFAGVGNVALDGGYGSYRFRDLATLEAFAGVQAPLTGEFEVADWENSAYGGRLTFHIPENLTTALSFARQNREAIAYNEPGEFTNRRLDLPADQEELYGANVSWRFQPGSTAYGRVEWDRLQWRLKVAGGALNLTRPGAKWSADLEYFHRAPSLYANSLLSVFDQADFDVFGARASYLVTPTIRAFGNLNLTFLDGDSGQRLGAGVGRGPWSVSYTHRMGYTGDSDAVVGAYEHTITEEASVRANAGYTSYELSASQDERNDSFVLGLGGEVRPLRTLAFDVEIQNLSQDLNTQPEFAGYEHDWRGHVRITYWFFTGRGLKEVF
jgi:hypothetical protein